MRGLSFIADREMYAVDVTLVQKVARNMTVTPLRTAPDSVIGITNLKGRVVTVLSISALLGHGSGKLFMDTINAVIIKAFANGEQMGLRIDAPGGLIEIDEEAILKPPLETNAQARLYISGVAEINGVLYRIIDIESVINRFGHDSGKQIQEEEIKNA